MFRIDTVQNSAIDEKTSLFVHYMFLYEEMIVLPKRKGERAPEYSVHPPYGGDDEKKTVFDQHLYKNSISAVPPYRFTLVDSVSSDQYARKKCGRAL